MRFNLTNSLLFLDQIKTLVSQPGALSMMQAPLGYSYRCLAPKRYTMLPLDGARDNATLVLTNFQFQSFLEAETAFGEGKSIESFDFFTTLSTT